MQHACTCEDDWQGWDGLRESLDRHVLAARRLEQRRSPGLIAASHREDLPLDSAEFQGRGEIDSTVPGSWSNAEFLTTVREAMDNENPTR